MLLWSTMLLFCFRFAFFLFALLIHEKSTKLCSSIQSSFDQQLLQLTIHKAWVEDSLQKSSSSYGPC